MKKIILSAFIILSISIYSQDFDEAYLESLPDDIREQVISESVKKKQAEKPVYRRPSSMIEKPEDQELNINYSVERFGAKFFSMMQSSFMPINEPNMDGSYVLDFGDTLELQLIGQESYEDEFPIKRDGSINIPDIGKVYVAGLSLETANDVIALKVKEYFIGTQAFVTLTNIRDIQVLVSGNAFNPGLYTLNGNSNILQALYLAGGINNDGTYRNIQHIRDGKVIHIFDLYDVFIKGISTTGNRLKSGDSILIPSASNIVNINGGVKRPALYELTKNEDLEDLINYANGFKHNADLDKMFLESFSKGVLSSTDINKDNLKLFKPSFGDTLHIAEFTYKKVLIEGAVEVPGEYLIVDGTTLSEVIKRAGGYKNSAYPFAGYLENELTKKKNVDAKEKLYNKFLESAALLSSSDEQSSLGLILDQIKDAPISGRVIAEFDLDLIEFNSELDTVLEDNDRLMIPYITQQVFIYGKVNNEGTVRYKPGMSIQYYIDRVGGFDDGGDSKNIFVTHPNGQTEVLKMNVLSSLSKRNNTLIFPGSVIYVPRKTDIKNSVQIASIWAPLVSSFALAATSLSVLSND